MIAGLRPDALSTRGVPFVFATGYSGRDVKDGHRDRPVLKKPFKYEELVENGDSSSLEQWAEQHYPGLIENVGLSFLADFVGDEVVRRKIFEMKWWL